MVVPGASAPSILKMSAAIALSLSKSVVESIMVTVSHAKNGRGRPKLIVNELLGEAFNAISDLRNAAITNVSFVLIGHGHKKAATYENQSHAHQPPISGFPSVNEKGALNCQLGARVYKVRLFGRIPDHGQKESCQENPTLLEQKLM
jgi:hypothetical protein